MPFGLQESPERYTSSSQLPRPIVFSNSGEEEGNPYQPSSMNGPRRTMTVVAY